MIIKTASVEVIQVVWVCMYVCNGEVMSYFLGFARKIPFLFPAFLY